MFHIYRTGKFVLHPDWRTFSNKVKQIIIVNNICMKENACTNITNKVLWKLRKKKTAARFDPVISALESSIYTNFCFSFCFYRGRVLGTVISSTVATVYIMILTLISLPLLNSVRLYIVMTIYCGLYILGFIYFKIFFKETEGKTLELIQKEMSSE